MKRIIEEIDFLWKGDPETLTIMWLAILLAIVSLIQLGITIKYMTK
jgi:hypothetical protein